MKWLSREEIDAVATRALVQSYGLTPEQARALVAARWPMPGSAVPSEALGRGLLITLSALQDWLHETVGECWPDGEPIDAGTTFLSPSLVDTALQWAVETGRARSSPVGERMTQDFKPVVRLLQAAKAGEN